MRLAFRGALGAVRLHGYVRIQMVQRAISFFAALPPTLVHPLDFLVATTGPLVLLRAWDGHKGVHLRERVRVLRGLAAPKAGAEKGVRDEPDLAVVRPWLPRLRRRLQCLASYTVHWAFHADVQRTAEANAGSPAAGGLGIGPFRDLVERRASMADRSDSTRLWTDL